MSSNANPVPAGYHSVTPYLIVEGVAALIDFLKEAFDAVETERLLGPDGSIGHAEVRLGDSVVMMGAGGKEFGPMPAALYFYVQDVDASYKRALDAGATSVMEPADQFYGDRSAGVKDAFGNLWFVATHKEDVSQEELARRAAARAKG
jgi:PhnB protein